VDYLNVAEARELPGLRIVLTASVPGPWGEALKSILDYKDLGYVAVEQLAGEENAELQAWTGQNSAPVALYEQEAPRVSWLDQLYLAERLAPRRPLLPADLEERALVIGLSRELAGELGLGWNRRLQLLGLTMLTDKAPPGIARMAHKYGWSEAEHARCGQRINDCLNYFSSRLRTQQAVQSRYLVGFDVSAADMYLVNFLGMLQPLKHDLNPMPGYMRQAYEYVAEDTAAAMDPILFEYRDEMYQKHLKTPLDF